MKKETKLWLDYAQDDLKSLEVMWKAHRYGPTAFYCQQALEKIIKAGIIEFANERPPKIHDLFKLNQKAGIKIPKKWHKIMKLLTRHYYLVRYPDMVKAYTGSRLKMTPIIKEVKELYQWLLKKFNQ